MENRIILLKEAHNQIEKIISAVETACKEEISTFKDEIITNLEDAGLDFESLADCILEKNLNDISDEELRIARIDLGIIKMH